LRRLNVSDGDDDGSVDIACYINSESTGFSVVSVVFVVLAVFVMTLVLPFAFLAAFVLMVTFVMIVMVAVFAMCKRPVVLMTMFAVVFGERETGIGSINPSVKGKLSCVVRGNHILDLVVSNTAFSL